MKTSAKGMAFLASLEGIVIGPYKDSEGIWTYGIGHTAKAGSPNPDTMPRGKWGDVKDAVEVFKRDIENYEEDVNDAVSADVTQSEFDALVSFHYNTGGIYGARLTTLLNNGDKAEAANAFMGWTKPAIITGRRKKEQQLFQSGQYASDDIPIYTPDAKGGYKRTGSITQSEFISMVGGFSGNDRDALSWLFDLFMRWGRK